MARTLLFNSMINLRIWSWQNKTKTKTKEKETKSSKLEATVYYIYTCQFPNRLQEQEQQFANRLQEQEIEEQEQEKEQMVFAGVASYRFYSVLLCFYLHEQYIF